MADARLPPKRRSANPSTQQCFGVLVTASGFDTPLTPRYRHPVSGRIGFLPHAYGNGSASLPVSQSPFQSLLLYSGYCCDTSIGYRLTKLQWPSTIFSGRLYIIVYVILESFEHCNSVQVTLAHTLCARIGL